MGLTTKSYWKWNSKFNMNEYHIGQILSNNYISKKLIKRKEDINNENYHPTERPDIHLIISENRIKSIMYTKFPVVGKLSIERELQKDVEIKISKLLEKCDPEYEGSKLILCYLDFYLGAVVITE